MDNRSFQPEIQGLRALAVSAVLLFHLAPGLLPGGYIGVDVFFVISGYLIGGKLAREGASTGAIDLKSFYIRRARRLIPAASLVLGCVFLLTFFLLPPMQWEDVAHDVIASSLYFENLRLADLAVDYLGAEALPSPVQHYWSLSVEEQFYILWPLLIGAMCIACRSINRVLTSALAVAFLLVTALSLTVSWWATERDAASAYLMTSARIWELGFGSLIALLPTQALPRIRTIGVPVGLFVVAVACLQFSAQTPFPGLAALLPVVGSGLVILGAGNDRSGISAVLNSSAFQFLGAISYSLYLWHWPLIVFYVARFGPPGPIVSLGIIALSLFLAWITKRFVEDRFRVPPGKPLKSRPLPAIAVVGGISSPLAAACVTVVLISRTTFPSPSDDLYPGAAILISGDRLPDVESYMPPLTLVKKDNAAQLKKSCKRLATPLAPCHFGLANSSTTVVLAGDSHALQWVPALEIIAKKRGWELITYTKARCPILPLAVDRHGKPYLTCLAWGRKVLKEIAKIKPDLLLLAQTHNHKLFGESSDSKTAIQDGATEVFIAVSNEGIQVATIEDPPVWENDPALCIRDARNCVMPLTAYDDPFTLAGERNPAVAVVRVNEYVCPNHRCPAVIGNVVVWRDRHHLTTTFARTMAGPLTKQIDDALSKVGAHLTNSPKETEDTAYHAPVWIELKD